MIPNDKLDSIFPPEFLEKIATVRKQSEANIDLAQADAAEIREMAQAVLGAGQGAILLQRLTQITYLKPNYPPPAGQTAGEYAAQCEGQRQIVAMLIEWSKKE